MTTAVPGATDAETLVTALPCTIWELQQGFSFSGHSIGLYSTPEKALLAADQVVAGYRASQASDPDFDAESAEEVWDEVIWFEYTEPRVGYTQIRGQYGFQSYFVLRPRTLT